LKYKRLHDKAKYIPTIGVRGIDRGIGLRGCIGTGGHTDFDLYANINSALGILVCFSRQDRQIIQGNRSPAKALLCNYTS
jgi:hypothetical protein